MNSFLSHQRLHISLIVGSKLLSSFVSRVSSILTSKVYIKTVTRTVFMSIGCWHSFLTVPSIWTVRPFCQSKNDLNYPKCPHLRNNQIFLRLYCFDRWNPFYVKKKKKNKKILVFFCFIPLHHNKHKDSAYYDISSHF